MRQTAASVPPARSFHRTAQLTLSIATALAIAPAMAGALALAMAGALVGDGLSVRPPELESALVACLVLVAVAAIALGRWQYRAVVRPLLLLGAEDPIQAAGKTALARWPRELVLLCERLRSIEQPPPAPERDRLTGLLTSSGLLEVTAETVEIARGQGRRLALAVVDVAQLRDINTTHGYTVGDEVLRQLARRLSAICMVGASVSRIGGDRFALLLPVDPDDADASRWPRAILAALRRPYCIDGCELQVGIRLGSSLFPEHGATCQQLLRAAELALESARRGDGRTWCQFDPGLNHAAVQQRALEKELRQALEQNHLALHYQPQIELGSGRVVGVEALLRWPHPAKGMIPPQAFIPIAEASGLIRPLGAWVLVEATNAARRWHEQGLPVGISVNVSAAQLRRPDLVRLVEQVLVSTGLPPDTLELELTESMFVDPSQIAMHRTIQGIASLGVRLSIDDFGTGYSSLGYLKRLPVDKIKIDKSFVRELGSDETDAAIVRSIIALAQIFGKRVLAEGVEEASQARFLLGEGCDEAQGYYFSRPMPEAACTAFLQRHLASSSAQALAS